MLLLREVKIPKAVGLDRDKKKEDEYQLSRGMMALHNVLCVHEEVRNDFAEFDDEQELKDDDDNRSVVSSVVSRATADDASESSDEDDEETEKKASSTLKHLGNIKKHRLSKLLFKDLIGEDGDEAIRHIKKAHQKEIGRVTRKMKFVQLVNRHFNRKIDERMDALEKRTEASVTNTFTRRDYKWRNAYRELMMEKRQRTSSNA